MPYTPTEVLIGACVGLLAALIGSLAPAAVRALWLAAAPVDQRNAGHGVARAIGEIREAFREPPRPPRPQMKIDPPEAYEGKPEKIAHWLRSMRAYFALTEVLNGTQMIAIALQRIKGGTANRAENWAGVKLQEFMEFIDEITNTPRAKDYTWRQLRMGVEPRDEVVGVVSPTGEMVVTPRPAELGIAPFTHQPPFDDWNDFEAKALAFFMTTETRDEAIRHLRELKQGKRPVEDYIIDFKSWAQLTNFNEIALIAQFKGGLNPPLGMKIVENGAPGDGATA